MRKKLKNVLLKNDSAFNSMKLINFKLSSILFNILGDKELIKMQYFARLGKFLNLNDPELYNEKIQWLKLNYRNPLLKTCVDKWEVRKYVSSKGLSDILIPAFGPYESIKDIKLDEMPESFIIKLTNGSGFNEICFDKKKYSLKKTEDKFNRWQKINFYHSRREWAYDGVPNRILCEHLIQDSEMNLPSDVRFFCFHGRVKLIAIDLESVRGGKKTSNYFRHLLTPEWEEVDAVIQYPKKKNFKPEKPKNLESMIKIAEILAEDFPSVRVDLYNDNGKIYFGELTFYHASGYQKITPEKFEYEMGSWLNLSLIK